MFYKKAYKKAVASRDEWRRVYLDRGNEIRNLDHKIQKLKNMCDWLERENEKLRAKEPSTFDKMTYQKLKGENEELKEKLKRAEMKLSAKDSADKAFKDNCCFGLAFLGETVRELNKQDEEQKRREDFLFRAVEGLAGEILALKQQPGEEPGRAITIGKPRTENETEQPETEDKKNDK